VFTYCKIREPDDLAVAVARSGPQASPMPDPGWRCSACGRTSEEADRARALAGRSALGADALACGQGCALALVEREIATATQVLARAEGHAAPHDGDEADGRARVPRLAAYVAVMSMTGGGT
jgi:hypothetical protein